MNNPIDPADNTTKGFAIGGGGMLGAALGYKISLMTSTAPLLPVALGCGLMAMMVQENWDNSSVQLGASDSIFSSVNMSPMCVARYGAIAGAIYYLMPTPDDANKALAAGLVSGMSSLVYTPAIRN